MVFELSAVVGLTQDYHVGVAGVQPDQLGNARVGAMRRAAFRGQPGPFHNPYEAALGSLDALGEPVLHGGRELHSDWNFGPNITRQGGFRSGIKAGQMRPMLLGQRDRRLDAAGTGLTVVDVDQKVLERHVRILLVIWWPDDAPAPQVALPPSPYTPHAVRSFAPKSRADRGAFTRGP